MAYGIALIVAGSRGNRLLFLCTDTDKLNGECVNESLLKELSPKILAELLIPNPKAANRQFDLTVDQWKFLGHSKFCVSSQIIFNIVFVLKGSVNIDCCQRVVDQLAAGLAHEEERVGYLSNQTTLMMQILEEEGEGDEALHGSMSPYLQMIKRQCHLACLLHRILKCVKEKKLYVSERINDWSLVSVLQYPLKLGDDLVRPYHAVLLLEDGNKLLSELPPYCSPTFVRLVKVASPPTRSLEQISVDADLPLGLVVQLVAHLIEWRKAIAIAPLSENNVYSTSPHAQEIITDELKAQFEADYPHCNLIEFLSHFSQPLSLRDHQLFRGSDTEDHVSSTEGGQFVQMVGWLLKHRLIIQLHIYIFVVPQYSTVDTPSVISEDDKELFQRLRKYFNGSHHLEEIMYLEDMTRSELLTLLDKFSSLLVTCTLPAS